MHNDLFDNMAIENEIKEHFGLSVDIATLITPKIPVSRTDHALVLLSTKKQLYVYIVGTSRLTLGTIQKMIRRMGLVAESYVPPRNKPNYFDEIAREKFKSVFPGRTHITDSDLTYYRTLVDYNPALVVISEVRDGTIYQYDADARTGWRPAAKFAYRRIKTS